jgi:hypothetical protein
VKILKPTSELNLHSRYEEQIENLTDRNIPYAGMDFHCESLKRKYRNCLHRPVGPTGKFNCHGLTFASRRTAIDGSVVEKILREDEYREVQLQDVKTGDIVVYRNGADVPHSGLVVRGFPDIWILSKWGAAHEVVHGVDDCDYVGHKTFYRIIDEIPRL